MGYLLSGLIMAFFQANHGIRNKKRGALLTYFCMGLTASFFLHHQAVWFYL